jgi:hypothetical protein
MHALGVTISRAMFHAGPVIPNEVENLRWGD